MKLSEALENACKTAGSIAVVVTALPILGPAGVLTTAGAAVAVGAGLTAAAVDYVNEEKRYTDSDNN